MAQFYPLLVPVIFLFVALASWRLKRVVQPLRLKIAVKGEQLLAEQNLSDAVKEQIHVMLDTAFGARWLLLPSIVVLPFFALATLFNPRFIDETEREFHIGDWKLRAEYDELDKIHMIVMFANNPILSILIAAEMVLVLPIILAGRMIFYGSAVSPSSTVVALTKSIDQSRRYFHVPQSKAA
jgi:hypothetical protein